MVIVGDKFSVKKVKKVILKTYPLSKMNSKASNPYIIYLDLSMHGIEVQFDISIMPLLPREYESVMLMSGQMEQRINIVTVTRQLVSKFLAIHSAYRSKNLEVYIKDFYDLKALYILNSPIDKAKIKVNFEEVLLEIKIIGPLMNKKPDHVSIDYDGFLSNEYWSQIATNYHKYLVRNNLDDFDVGFDLIVDEMIDCLREVFMVENK